MRAYRQTKPRPIFPLRSTRQPVAAGPSDQRSSLMVMHGRRSASDHPAPATDNSPQTNHIKNITPLFPHTRKITSDYGSFTDAPRPRASEELPRALDRETSKRVTNFAPGEIAAAPARQVLRTRGGGGVMPDQDELDAMTKAWTYAVLDALEAADEKTRLEIVRILCPAGFVIVPAGSMELLTEQKH
jgi:hypothetical protein